MRRRARASPLPADENTEDPNSPRAKRRTISRREILSRRVMFRPHRGRVRPPSSSTSASALAPSLPLSTEGSPAHSELGVLAHLNNESSLATLDITIEKAEHRASPALEEYPGHDSVPFKRRT